MENNNQKRAICGICPAGCWVKVNYDESGKLDEVRPDDSSPLGVICTLGQHSKDIVYSKDRLKYPLKRKGPKGSFEFERISWDEAYETIVSRMQSIKQESGPEATAIYTGRGSFELAMCDVFQPKNVAVSSASSVLFPFGSPNTLGVGALCYVSFAMIAPHVTMGGMMINMFSDLEQAEMIVVWGANPATDSPPLDYDRVLAAHKRGAKIVVIDPRKTKTAKVTDAEWIPIRPGTDGALALGMCQVVIEEELFDEAFVDDWTHGFDEFARYSQHFRPEVVEDITGVPADTIRNLAREMVAADGVAPIMYSGLEYSDSGVQAIRATMALWALAGQMDVPGGRCFSMLDNYFPINRDGLIANPDESKALGRDRFPVYSQYRGESHAISLPESILERKPYKIRSLIILGGSIITSWPQPSIWKKTLNELDFLVTIDRQLTADSAYADIVLPATTMYEIDSYMTYGPIFRLREKVIEPLGEARNDFFIMAELAARLGYGHLYPQNEDELLKHVLKGSGYTLDEVRKAGGTIQLPSSIQQYKKWEKGGLRDDNNPGFQTPSSKFEFMSETLDEHGYDPLPVYTEPSEGPISQSELAKKFPLIFNSGSRVNSDFRSQHHGVKSLNKKRPEPIVTLNTTDAEGRNIKTGDLVKISTKRGSIRMRAFVTDDIIQGAIDADMGGGGPVGPQSWQEANINDLTDLQNYDPISGFPVYKTLLCEIEKVSAKRSKHGINSGEDDLLSDGPIDTVDTTPQLRIYLDHNATTPIHGRVKDVMIEYLDKGQGNPSGIYREGKEARTIVESARRTVASLINTTARRIIFTGSGSEADNLALKGIALATHNTKRHLITSEIEHPAILNTCKWLERKGFEVTYLPVDEHGLIHVEELRNAIRPDTFLVSIMLANNETGVIQPLEELIKVTHEHQALFHCDAVQAVGKIPVDVKQLDVDLLSLSAHKFYGPKGVGALYLKKGVVIDPLINGGKQEEALRAGTENVLAIAGLGKAAELALKNLPAMPGLAKHRDRLMAGVREVLPDVILNGHQDKRLPGTCNIQLPGMRGESVVLAMDQKGVSLSSGSACRAGSPDPSSALLAMGMSDEQAHCSIRFSLGLNTTAEEIELTLERFKEVVEHAHSNVRFVPCR